jgi:hypothetical protein
MPVGLSVLDIDTDIINPLNGTSVTVSGVAIDSPTSTPAPTQGSNLAIGTNAMSSIVAGTANIAIGEDSLKNYNSANENLGFNTAIGVRSMEDTTYGDYNVAIGFEAMKKNIGGQSNVAIGYQSLGSSTLSPAPLGNDANIAIGVQSLKEVTVAAGNVAIGVNSGTQVSTGLWNCLLGTAAGQLLTTGSNNICIGYQSAAPTVTTSNSITLGNSSHTVIRAAVTTITSLSDERDKKDIKDLSTGLEFVEALRPVEFTWNDRDENGKHDIADFGFIAQDLKKAQEDAEKAEVLKLVYEENPEKLEASYGKLIPILVKAIQELSEEVKQLKNK